jgi:hypothetical protein
MPLLRYLIFKEQYFIKVAQTAFDRKTVTSTLDWKLYHSKKNCQQGVRKNFSDNLKVQPTQARR